jgi:VWFA-related protein
MALMNRLAAVALLLAAGVAVAAQQPQYTIRVGVDLVDVNFSVTDRKGRLISNLSATDFAVEEDGKRQDIVRFSRESELPLTLAILVDTSPSVKPVFLEQTRTASAFIESILRPKDLALVITFDRRVTLMEDFTDSTRQLTSTIEALQLGGGGTSLFDAVYLAAQEKLAKEIGRKAVILISDGEDTTSKVDMSRALVSAHQSNAIIYSISNADGGSPKTLRKLSQDTGGDVFFVRRTGDFQKVFDQITLELRSQYSISYHSNNLDRDGRFRRIKILTKDSGLNVRARTGYYASKAP